MKRTQETDGEEEEETSPLEEVGVQWRTQERGPDREGMVSNYLPDQDDWLAKTVLELNDPGRIAALIEFYRIFPEVEDLQPVIDEFLEQFLRGKTSVGGASRSEYQRIFESMYGGGNSETKKAGQMLAEAVAADIDEDD